jgi:hypothetical protein
VAQRFSAAISSSSPIAAFAAEVLSKAIIDSLFAQHLSV